MRTRLCRAAMLLWLAAGTNAAAGVIAFQPVEPADTALAVNVNRYLIWALDRRYTLVPPADFAAILETESARREELELPGEGFFPYLQRKTGASHLVSVFLEPAPAAAGKEETGAPAGEETAVEAAPEGQAAAETSPPVEPAAAVVPAPAEFRWQVSFFDLRTGRRRWLETTVTETSRPAALRRFALQVRDHLIFLEQTGPASDRRDDIGAALRARLPRRPRPPTAVAFLEETAGEFSPRLHVEEALGFYLRAAGFPVRDGESHLLRAYVRSYYGSGLWTFPTTLASEFYFIGRAEVIEGADYHGLKGAEARLEIKLLDRRGKVVDERVIRTGAYGVGFSDAAVPRALDTAVAEAAFLLFPSVRYR